MSDFLKVLNERTSAEHFDFDQVLAFNISPE
jgi:hypothetical protein